MTNGSSQGLFVIVSVVIFGIFVGISYLLFQDKMTTGLSQIFCDGFSQSNDLSKLGKGTCGNESKEDVEKLPDLPNSCNIDYTKEVSPSNNIHLKTSDMENVTIKGISPNSGWETIFNSKRIKVREENKSKGESEIWVTVHLNQKNEKFYLDSQEEYQDINDFIQNKQSSSRYYSNFLFDYLMETIFSKEDMRETNEIQQKIKYKKEGIDEYIDRLDEIDSKYDLFRNAFTYFKNLERKDLKSRESNTRENVVKTINNFKELDYDTSNLDKDAYNFYLEEYNNYNIDYDKLTKLVGKDGTIEEEFDGNVTVFTKMVSEYEIVEISNGKNRDLEQLWDNMDNLPEGGSFSLPQTIDGKPLGIDSTSSRMIGAFSKLEKIDLGNLEKVHANFFFDFNDDTKYIKTIYAKDLTTIIYTGDGFDADELIKEHCLYNVKKHKPYSPIPM